MPAHASAVPAALIERLKEVVGPGGWLSDPAETEPYRVSWRDTWEGETPLVVRPANTAQVAAVVRLCAEAAVAMVPQGGNTGLTGAGQPRPGNTDIVIATDRLKAIRDLDTLNNTMTVEAGVVLQTIQEAAAEANRLFPLSLAAEGSCQIGGNIVTNAGGTQVLRYGNTRALVLGLEVVLPDGQVWNGLRGLRKDNTGYDMKQLFIGSEGTLGIVTAAVLRLFPRPTETQTAMVGLADPDAAVRLLGHMQDRLGEQVTAFELMGRSCIDYALAALDGVSDPLDEPHPWYVLLEVAGQGAPESLREPLEEALADAFEAALIGDAVIAASGDQRRALWTLREEQAEAQKRIGPGIKHDVSVPLSAIAEFLERADAALEAAYPGIRHSAFGHVGDGNMHYNPIAPEGFDDFPAETARINRIVHDIVAELNGSISAEHGLGRMRLTEAEHYKPPVELAMMRAVKRALDPKGLMNPGKMLAAGD